MADSFGASEPVGMESDAILRTARAVYVSAGLALSGGRDEPADSRDPARLRIPHPGLAVRCLGPATLFFFVLYFTRSRGWALAVALAYTFYSPLYYFVPAIDRDRGIAYLPWRLQVLMKYGEGPHNLGLTLIPLALVSVWRAGVGKGFQPVRGGAVAGGRRADQLDRSAGAGILLPDAAGHAVGIVPGNGIPGVSCFRSGGFGIRAGLLFVHAQLHRRHRFQLAEGRLQLSFSAAAGSLVGGAANCSPATEGCFWRAFFHANIICGLSRLVFRIRLGGALFLLYRRRYDSGIPPLCSQMEMFLALLVFEIFRQPWRAHCATAFFHALRDAVVLPVESGTATDVLRARLSRALAVPGGEYGIQRPRGGTACGIAAPGPRVRLRRSSLWLNSWFDIPQVGGGFDPD